jgi:hypothetical protein
VVNAIMFARSRLRAAADPAVARDVIARFRRWVLVEMLGACATCMGCALFLLRP